MSLLRLCVCFGVMIGAACASAQAQTVTNPLGAAPVTPRGPFMISADQNVVWRVDQTTGAISYCIRDTNSTDRELIAQRPPICSAWGK